MHDLRPSPPAQSLAHPAMMCHPSLAASPCSTPRAPRPSGLNYPCLLLLAAAVASVVAAEPLNPPAVSPDTLPSQRSCPLDRGAGRTLELQLEALPASLATSSAHGEPAAYVPRQVLPWVYGWLVTPAGRRRVKCLLDSGASHCFLSSALAAQLQWCRLPLPASHPSSVQQADCSTRRIGGVVAAQLLLGGLDEETTFIEFDVDCEGTSSSTQRRPSVSSAGPPSASSVTSVISERVVAVDPRNLSHGGCRRGVGHAHTMHRRAQLRGPSKLLP